MTTPRRAFVSEKPNNDKTTYQSPGQITMPTRPDAHVQPEYSVIVDSDRKYVDVSESFCKLLGYRREELIGEKYDVLTVPKTNDIPTVFSLFVSAGYMHGIWVFAHRRGTRILVRYEAWFRSDGLIECQMDLLGAGA